jgi:(p)ppGpp synthase/HD superfamily hydrolase
MTTPSVEDAIRLALERHAGQRDQNGAPYVLHPLRVMAAMRTDEERRVAVLHDVVEDAGVTLDELRRMGYGEREVLAIDALSRRDGEPYEDYVARAGRDPLARRVKLADLADNMDVRRLAGVDEAARQRLERNRRAWERLAGDG